MMVKTRYLLAFLSIFACSTFALDNDQFDQELPITPENQPIMQKEHVEALRQSFCTKVGQKLRACMPQFKYRLPVCSLFVAKILVDNAVVVAAVDQIGATKAFAHSLENACGATDYNCQENIKDLQHWADVARPGDIAVAICGCASVIIDILSLAKYMNAGPVKIIFLGTATSSLLNLMGLIIASKDYGFLCKAESESIKHVGTTVTDALSYAIQKAPYTMAIDGIAAGSVPVLVCFYFCALRAKCCE